MICFFENSIPKHLPIDFIEMMIETQTYTAELSMIESNGRACWEGKGRRLRERMNIGREGPIAVINSCSRGIQHNTRGDLRVKQAIERESMS